MHCCHLERNETMKSIIIATVVVPFIGGIYNGWTISEKELVYNNNQMRYDRWVEEVTFASGLRDALHLPEDSFVTIPAPNHQ
jgi:hypothetical protein